MFSFGLKSVDLTLPFFSVTYKRDEKEREEETNIFTQENIQNAENTKQRKIK